MRTLFILLIFVYTASAAGIYDCAYYEPQNCTLLSVPPCDTSSKTCYAHPNVCGSLRRYITSGYIGTGWTVVLSSYSFQCLPSNIADCISESAITATPPLSIGPSFCIPLNMELYNNNITIRTLGNRPATIYTPVPSPTTRTCSILKFSGENITIQSVNIDASNCDLAVIPSTGIMLGNSGANITNVEFVNVQTMISLYGTDCDRITITNADSSMMPIPPFYYPIMIAATACDNTVPIRYSSTTNNVYAAILTGPPTLLQPTIQLSVLEFNKFQTKYVYQQPPCIIGNTTACPECTSDTNYIYIIIPLMIFVAMIVIYGLSKALKKTRAKIYHNQ